MHLNTDSLTASTFNIHNPNDIVPTVKLQIKWRIDNLIDYPVTSYFVGRKEWLNRLHTEFQKKNTSYISQIRLKVISGLGGIGKTQLVRYYAGKYQQEYNIVWFIEAENKSKIIDSLVRLGRKLKKYSNFKVGLPFKLKSREEKARLVLKWLKKNRNVKWLLVYDNVETESKIQYWLPQGANNEGHILITSRSSLFTGMCVFNLDTLKENKIAAIRLIWQHLHKQEISNGEIINSEEARNLSKVAETVGYLPLALSLAGSYLAHGMPIETYITKLKTREKTLLAAQDQKKPRDYLYGLLNVWLMNWEALSEPAKELLRMIALVDSEKQPRFLWEAVVSKLDMLNKNENIESLLDELCRHSLVGYHIGGDSISTHYHCHRLVQAMVLDTIPLKEYIRYEQYLVKVIHELCELSAKEKDNKNLMKAERKRSALLPHWESLALKHMQKNMIEDSNSPDEIESIYRISYWRLHIYYEKRLVSEALAVGKSACKLAKSRYGKKSIEFIKVKNKIAGAYLVSGNIKQALDLFNETLEIIKGLDRQQEEKFDINKINKNIALAYLLNGEIEKSIKLYKNILQIKISEYGKQHLRVARIKEKLAGAYLILGDARETVKLYEEALSVLEKNYPGQHKFVITTRLNLAMAYCLDKYDENAEIQYQKSLGSSITGVRILYAMFLFYKKRYKDALAQLEPLIKQTIRITVQVYSEKLAFFLDRFLQKDVREHGQLVIRHELLFHYYLVRCYQILGDADKLNAAFSEFKNFVDEMDTPLAKRILSYTCSQENQIAPLDMVNINRPTINIKKTKRNSDKEELFESSNLRAVEVVDSEFTDMNSRIYSSQSQLYKSSEHSLAHNLDMYFKLLSAIEVNDINTSKVLVNLFKSNSPELINYTHSHKLIHGPLFAAIRHIRPRIVDVLLSNGADPNIAKIDNDVALQEIGGFRSEFYTPISYASACYAATKSKEKKLFLLEILESLLCSRPYVPVALLERWMTFCKNCVDYDKNSKQLVLDYAISHLVSQNIADPKIDWFQHYQALHNEKSSGGSHEITLTVRIAALFHHLLDKMVFGDESFRSYKKEILVELEALHWLADIKAIPNELQINPNYQTKIDSKIYLKNLPNIILDIFSTTRSFTCFQAIVDNVINKLLKLGPGEEYVLPTGWSVPPHAVCVCLTHINDTIVIRVDNSEPPEYLIDVSYNPMLKPKVLGCIPYESLQDGRIARYLTNIVVITRVLYSNNIKISSTDAEKLIYNLEYVKKNDDEEYDIKFAIPFDDIQTTFPEFRPQADSNCYVKSHEPGLRYRLQLFGDERQLNKEQQQRLYTRVEAAEKMFLPDKVISRQLDFLCGPRFYLKQYYKKQLTRQIKHTESGIRPLFVVKKISSQVILEIPFSELLEKPNSKPRFIYDSRGINKKVFCRTIVKQWLYHRGKDEWLFWIPLKELIKYNGVIKEWRDAYVFMARVLFNLPDLPSYLRQQFEKLASENKVHWLLGDIENIDSYENLCKWLNEHLLSRSNVMITTACYSLMFIKLKKADCFKVTVTEEKLSFAH